MTARINLLRFQGGSNGAQLLLGRQQQVGKSAVTCINRRSKQGAILIPPSRSHSICSSSNSSMKNCNINDPRARLLASLSSSNICTVVRGITSNRKPSLSSSFWDSRSSPLRCKAPFSSKASPEEGDTSSDEEEQAESDRGESEEEFEYIPMLKLFAWGEDHERLANLDDGDKYGDFVDLRLDEKEKFFPEGLAGETQGALERAKSMGIPTALIRREAAEALILSLDGFAEAGDASGIEGTMSKKWQKIKLARQKCVNGEESVGDDSEGSDSVSEDDDQLIDVGFGDVGAAAAEAKAAAAAAVAAVAAAAAPVTVDANIGEVSVECAAEESAEEDKDGKKILGSGPIWNEMKVLAESKRKGLKDVRSVRLQPGQRSHLLTGQRGSGKSCILNQVVLHARSTGWIVLFVPDGRNLVQKGIYCQPSPVFEDMYDLPVQSVKRLKALRSAHADQLKDINIKDPEVLARHEGAKTLLDLVELGVDDEEKAGTAHYDVMRELLATTEAKVLLAIDEYNELFQPSHWHFDDNKLEAPHLTATSPLLPSLKAAVTGLSFADEKLSSLANPTTGKTVKNKKGVAAADLPLLDTETGGACLPPPPANGIVVCAVSERYPPVKQIKKRKKWIPFESVAGRLAKAVSVRVEPYTRHEFLRVVKHYSRVEEVMLEPLNNQELAKVHIKSDGVAEWVFNTCICGYFRIFVPE